MCHRISHCLPFQLYLVDCLNHIGRVIALLSGYLATMNEKNEHMLLNKESAGHSLFLRKKTVRESLLVSHEWCVM
jgi:hypothetical protein